MAHDGSLTIDDRHAGLLLRRLYDRYHRPEFIHPDPLEIVLERAPGEREVSGFIAASLALGRVDLILAAVRGLLARIEPPVETLSGATIDELRERLRGFRYRFFDSENVVSFLWGIGECLRRYGSIGQCLEACIEPGDEDVVPGLGRFAELFRSMCPGEIGILMSDIRKGGACKRLNLYLRWMTRHDSIDPGGFQLSPAMLIVPVDVHMLRTSRMLGFTQRKVPDLRASREITMALARYCPEDPVKYDFSMTRLGIHPDLRYTDLFGE